MSVFYRKEKGRWVVRYAVATGVWKQKLCPAAVTTERQAKAWEATFVAHAKEGGEVVARRMRGEEPTLRELAKRWLKLRATLVKDDELAPATVVDNRSALDSRILPAFGDRHLSTITTAELREWVRAMRGEVSSHRCRNVANTFKVMCEDALAEDWVKLLGNPLDHPGVRKELPTARNVSKDVIHLSVAQATALLACRTIGVMPRVRYSLALTTGLRGGELAGLSVGDVDLQASPPRLTVRQAWRLKGRGLGSLKTASAERVAPLCPLAAAALGVWLDVYWETLVGRKPKAQDPLFPGPDGKPYRFDHEAKEFRNDLDIAKQDDTLNGHPIDAHAMRRSFATWLMNAGVAQPDRQRLMGHMPKGVTEKHYTATELGRLYEAVCLPPLGPELLADLVPTVVPSGHQTDSKHA